jgi:FkbM family methyltransferase
MLLSVGEIVSNWGVKPNGVLHVGAHHAEEAEDYEKFNWLPVTWVEAHPDLANQLKSKLDPANHKILAAAVWNLDDLHLNLNVASNSMSSSLLEFGSHLDSHPDITFINQVKVLTKRLDSILEPTNMPNLLNIDIQGAELRALMGLGDLIDRIDFIIVEVNKWEVYKDCPLITDLDDFLFRKGFKRVNTRWILKEGWGDALYIRSDKIERRNLLQIVRSKVQECLFYAPHVLRVLTPPVLRRSLKTFKSKFLYPN